MLQCPIRKNPHNTGIIKRAIFEKQRAQSKANSLFAVVNLKHYLYTVCSLKFPTRNLGWVLEAQRREQAKVDEAKQHGVELQERGHHCEVDVSILQEAGTL